METLERWYSYFLFVFRNTHTKKIIVTFADLFSQMCLFVLVGIVASALLTLYFPRDRINRGFSGHGFAAVIIATFLGGISPVGTYAVIPIIASLLKSKAIPVAPLIAFLIASPLINPILFFLTLGAFGPEMAVMRVAASIGLGLVGGLIAQRLWRHAGNGQTQSGHATPAIPGGPFSWRQLGMELLKQGKFIGRVFLISLLVAALVNILVPSDLVLRVLGGNSKISVLIAVAAGGPLYACGGGSIPVIEVLYQSGMSKGAVLAFFISGPATKMSTLAALFASMEKRVVTLYLIVTLFGAFLFGIAYNLF